MRAGRLQPPSWCRPKQRAHQNAEIVASNMNKVSLADVFTTAKPCAAHAAALENMSEAALDHLAALAHRLLADARSQPVAAEKPSSAA